jgi:DNA-binding NarL/FixJ family response regulator
MFRALIVEDSACFRQILKGILVSRFPAMEIIEGTDGKEALEKVESSLPDLIFMDIKLPGESGLELTQKIKARHPNIMIIILSSCDLLEYREAALYHKADYFISKSSSANQLFDLVESVFLSVSKRCDPSPLLMPPSI